MNLVIFVYVAHAISILASILVFCSYSKVLDKTLGHKMIVVLTISDFIFHLSYISAEPSYTPNNPSFLSEPNSWAYIITNYCNFIQGIAIRFSLFWATSMAFFLFKFLHLKGGYSQSKYLIFSLIVVLFLSLLFGLTFINTDNMYLYTIPLLVAGGLTTFFYLRSASKLKKYTGNNAPLKTVRALYMYAFAQMITIAPQIFEDIDGPWNQWASYWTIYDCIDILLGLTGFANALVYFSQIPKDEKIRSSTKGSIYLDLSISTDESPTKEREIFLA